MASLNQFKILEQKCELYFELMEKNLSRNFSLNKVSDKPRFGFYLYMLECFSNIKDMNDIIDMITDTDFNKTINNDPSNDCGIDAIYIDEDNRIINLFNFKYRENYSPEKKQSKNDVFTSTKFTTAIITGKYRHLEGKIKNFAKEIIKRNNSREIWKMKLFMVTNESVGLSVDDKDIEQLKELYDLEVESLSLNEISVFMSYRPKPINAQFILGRDSVLTYAENPFVSAKSYLVKLSIPELIRITCNDKEYREKYNIEDVNPLSKKDMAYEVLYDNVRGFLDTKYNKNIYRTLEEEPSKFFMYNNGLTITAEDVQATEINGKTKYLITISNFQVVNGGQTLRTIHKFNNMDEHNLEKYLCDGEILVRIFKTNTKLANKIAEYTNSQNAISIIDLKSLATEQIQIEQILDNNNIIYTRKAGDTGLIPRKKYDYKISLEKFAQILYSIQGHPEKASNQKKKIFEKYYEDTFGEKNFDIRRSPDIVKRYFEIFKVYTSKKLEMSEQKIFYIMYLDEHYEKNIETNIDILEKCINEYKKGEKISLARKLIQTGFKEYVDNTLKI